MSKRLVKKSKEWAMALPPDVHAKVKAAAVAEWPSDYSMQAYKIREQTEAFDKMQLYTSTMDTSNEIISTCLEKSTSEWPDDYTMQVYTFEQQMQAAVDFFDYENSNIPADILENIKNLAFAEWQGDYSMMLYRLNEQIEGWLEVNS